MNNAALTQSERRKLIAIAIFALILAAPVAANAFTCPTVTTVGAAGNCGIVITAPGCYQIAPAQTATSDTADCVQIASSKVVLISSALFGTGSTSTAAGIHVLATTPGGGVGAAVVMGGSPITNVTIVSPGSLVAGFNVGVLSEANDVRIDGVSVSSNNTDGILLNNVKANRVSGVTATNNGANGISLVGSSGNLVSNCNVSNEGNGVSLLNSHGNTISGSSLGVVTGAGAILQTSNGNQLTGNTSNGNGIFGFEILGSSANTLSANTADDGAVGILIDGSPATELSANVLQNNSIDNIELTGNDSGSHLDSNSSDTSSGSGIKVLAGTTGLTITGNTTVDNATDLEDDNPACATNLWIADVFSIASQSCIH